LEQAENLKEAQGGKSTVLVALTNCLWKISKQSTLPSPPGRSEAPCRQARLETEQSRGLKILSPDSSGTPSHSVRLGVYHQRQILKDGRTSHVHGAAESIL
jgi:hypothetical protein